MKWHHLRRTQITFRDLDGVGHVYHPTYLCFLEDARTEFWQMIPGKKGLESLDFVIARVELDYKSSLTLGEAIEVRLRVSAVGTKSFALVYDIFSLDRQQTVLVASTVQVAFDYSTRTSMALSEEVRQKLLDLTR